MTKLTDAQRTLLTEAAREGGAERAAHAPTTIAALIKRGLLLSLPTAGGASRLMTTEAGRALIGETPPTAPEPARQPDQPERPQATPKGKIGVLLTLLRQPEGATLDAMMQATGWQAHSVRGAIAGAIKKTLKVEIRSEKTEAGRIYKAVEEAGA